MKKLIYNSLLIAISLAACNNNNNSGKVTGKEGTVVESRPELKDGNDKGSPDIEGSVPIPEIVDGYIRLMNALADDNTAGAAEAGKILYKTFNETAGTSASPEVNKLYTDLRTDASEHAEHIGANRGNIHHQREHFQMLSRDVYDLVKEYGSSQVLYKNVDSSSDSGKEVFWISETKEISNPYRGKEMRSTGTIVEVLDQTFRIPD